MGEFIVDNALKIFGGPRPGLWWELASLRQFLERVKI